MSPEKVAGPRALLHQLRALMAAEGAPQARLDTVTKIIATNMAADVCSLYLRRAGDVLELFSTYGLRPESVHLTRLRVGEGLIGEVVAKGKTLALADAQAHPLFAYRPETGEESFHSLLGVPLQRGGRVIGALSVQNRAKRQYSTEEAEVLQTVAMVLCELVLASALVAEGETADIDGNATLPLRFEGLPLAGGIGHGKAFLHRGPRLVHDLVSEDSERERERLDEAIDAFLRRIQILIAQSESRIGDAGREILGTYRMFAQDLGWQRRMREAVHDGLTAEGAVCRVQEENRRRLAPSPYFRDRIADFDDLSSQLLRELGGGADLVANDLPQDAVLVARSLGPAELLEYDRERLRAIVLGEGSPTSHMVLVARSLNIPVVGRIAGALTRFQPGDPVVVDGWRGLVHVRPDDSVYDDLVDSIEEESRRRADYETVRSMPAQSVDGVDFDLQLNVGLLSELPFFDSTGATGIGLLRTELLFLTHPTFPSVSDQEAAYREVLDAARGRPVVFRTFDLGGDKVLPNLDRPLMREENPAMGWRALRVGLDRPSVLRNQLRALISAVRGQPLTIMFPMAAEFAEVASARAILDIEIARQGQRGRPTPSSVQVGAMIEVPSLAWQANKVAEAADFVSIGTNDLLQYFFASDRTNPRLANRYDALSPSFLRLLRSIREACDLKGTPVAICGDMAANPLEAVCLAGLGFRTLSVPAPAYGAVKKALRSLDCAAIASYIEGRMGGADRSLRDEVRLFVQDRGFSF
ncbi:MAG: phosphoenolpyruvate--protein phosphotransferase [Alphaproteobacteria bacterium]